MAILPGKTVGPYQILSAIGAGGMGEVFKARDTRLDRTVAIKVLSAHLADRADLRERFDREARTIAGLNHPHICTLFDIGHQDGIDYLVMEYLEGETLADRLKKGPLPMEQVLQYAIEISDALDKAHRNGITHRDLKPGNIMLTKSGTKLLDFGLAKLQQESKPATPFSELATIQGGETAEGTILGTLQYMAPEQVEARPVDARTDIFAFGAVVYEMATGKKAFRRPEPGQFDRKDSGDRSAAYFIPSADDAARPRSPGEEMSGQGTREKMAGGERRMRRAEMDRRAGTGIAGRDAGNWSYSQKGFPRGSRLVGGCGDHPRCGGARHSSSLLPSASDGSEGRSLHDQPSRERKVSRACLRAHLSQCLAGRQQAGIHRCGLYGPFHALDTRPRFPHCSAAPRDGRRDWTFLVPG